jgi:hypothetical protein
LGRFAGPALRLAISGGGLCRGRRRRLCVHGGGSWSGVVRADFCPTRQAWGGGRRRPQCSFVPRGTDLVGSAPVPPRRHAGRWPWSPHTPHWVPKRNESRFGGALPRWGALSPAGPSWSGVEDFCLLFDFYRTYGPREASSYKSRRGGRSAGAERPPGCGSRPKTGPGSRGPAGATCCRGAS